MSKNPPTLAEQRAFIIERLPSVSTRADEMYRAILASIHRLALIDGEQRAANQPPETGHPMLCGCDDCR